MREADGLDMTFRGCDGDNRIAVPKSTPIDATGGALDIKKLGVMGQGETVSGCRPA